MISRILIAVMAAASAGVAYAGGLASAVTEEVITSPQVAENAGSMPSWVVPLVIFGAIAVVAASNGSGSSYDY